LPLLKKPKPFEPIFFHSARRFSSLFVLFNFNRKNENSVVFGDSAGGQVQHSYSVASLPFSRDLANSVAKMRLVQFNFGFAIQLELSKISRKNAIQPNSNIKKMGFPEPL